MDSDEIKFGPFLLDLRRRALFREGNPVHLGGRALDILCELASAAGKIVSKDDLMARLWPGRVVEEGNIPVHVSALRKALDNQGDGHSYVITVPGRGYRLTVREGLLSARPTEPLSAEDAERSSRSPAKDDVGEKARTIERRQLTLISCELPGASDLAKRLDAEDLSALAVSFYQYWTEIVGRFGGEARLAGDGMLACFGYPRAYECDAEQAILAGLALIAEAGRLGDAAEMLPLRLGIATGPVVLGVPIGSDASERRSIMGETVSRAATLRQMATPNTVVIDASTRRLVGALFEIRGISDRQAETDTFEVVRPSALQSRFEALHGSPRTALVGRKEELEFLLRRWRRTTAGEMQVVAISGEPGIGKSRLTVELQHCLQRERYTSLRYFCSPHHRDSALYPVIRQFEEAAGFHRNDTIELKIAKLKALMSQSVPEQDTSLLLEMLSLPSDIPPGQLTARRKRELTFEALIRYIDATSQREPVLIVFEDAHWSDPTTLEFLDLATRRIADRPILLLATFRPEFVPSWNGQAHFTSMMVHRLDRKESVELVRAAIGNVTLNIDLVEKIADRADGVPLFVEELSRTLIESRADPTYGEFSYSQSAVPATLQASLMERFDWLNAATKEVAQAGAAIGREFAYELVADVCSHVGPALDAALENLVTSGLAHRRGTPPNTVFVFKHVLVQDAVYSTLLRSKRQQLHARIAEALARTSETQAQQPELLGHHFAEAGQPEIAMRYWRIAVMRALQTSAYREAVGLCARGLEAVEAIAPQDERLREEAWLQLQMGIALTARFGPSAPEMLGAFSRAREVAEGLGEVGILSAAILGLWAHHNARANLKPALELAQRLFAIANSSGKETVRAQAHAASLTVTYKMGAFEEAWKNFEVGIALCRPEMQVFEAIPNYVRPRPDMLLHGSFVAWIMGYPERARRLAGETMVAAQETNQPYTITHCVYMLGHLAELQEDWHAVRRANEETVELATRWGFSGTLQLVERRISLVAVAIDRSEEQFQLKCKHRQPGFARSLHDVVLARTCASLGKLHQGLTLLDETLAYSRDTGSCFYDAEVHRTRAMLLVLLGYRKEAEDSYFTSIATARRQSARMWELRAATDLAGLWAGNGESRRAAGLLEPLYQQFTEGFDTPPLQAAKATLVAISA